MGRQRGRKPKTDKNYRKGPKGQALRKGESYREDKELYYFRRTRTCNLYQDGVELELVSRILDIPLRRPLETDYICSDFKKGRLILREGRIHR